LRIAVNYQKMGAARYVAHLDLQRALTRAFTRAKLPLAFSKGFHPHALVSLASALPVGAQGENEWMEAVLEGEWNTDSLQAALTDALPAGLAVRRVEKLPDQGKSLMALAARVDWLVEAPRGIAPCHLDSFLALKEIFVEKKGKKGTFKTVDIRPLILDMHFEGEQIFLSMTYGEGKSIRPDLVTEALCRHAGAEMNVPLMTRLGLFAQGKKGYVPLVEAAKAAATRPPQKKGAQA